jgi:serine protease inhibitor
VLPLPALPNLSEPFLTRRAVLQAFVVGIAGAALATACGRGAAVSVVADVSRAEPAAGTAAAVKAIDQLAADLYTRLAVADPGNLIFSPYSIEVALAMTRNGAVGLTRTQMDHVLHTVAGDELDNSFNALDRAMTSRSGARESEKRKGDVALDVANALWAQKDFAFEQPFLNALGKNYGAGVNIVDYKEDAAGAQKTINQWVSDRTHEKIADLIPDGVLDAMSRLVLTNAMYLKAPWLTVFAKQGDLPFHKPGGSTVRVPTMIGGSEGKYGEGDGWQAAAIPYLGNELSMVVIVPDDLSTFEKGLDGDRLASITAAIQDDVESVQMPLFTYRSKFSLNEQLAALGMPLAFRDDADFSAMTTSDQLKIAAVIHQGFLAVDEEGTEAAAATAVVMELTSGRVMPTAKKLIADKPFLFVIRDVPTGVTLFLGRVTDPAAT